MDAALQDMITLYQDLNGSEIDELPSEPSPLEFMRYVARNRPFVVRDAVRSWPAFKKWTPSYLNSVLADKTVKVAITPHGNADAPVYSAANSKTYFVKPLERDVLFPEFLSRLRTQTEPGDAIQPASPDTQARQAQQIWYAQTQNDNLRGEYSSLLPDVSPSIPWARIALQQEPDAVNMWIGSDQSVTALHRDNYENIYCQIAGEKHFVLIPPAEVGCVGERYLDQATYKLDEGGWSIAKDEGAEPVPCAMWDPDGGQRAEMGSDNGKGEERNKLCRPVRVSLKPGDILYLPALWYHKVSQSVGAEGVCVAVNYWYDVDFSGGLYATSNYFRDIALAKNEHNE